MVLARSYSQLPSLKISDPSFNFEESKWTIDRQKNIELLSEEFSKHANLVKVFSDNKLGSEPLVLLRKSKFEGMIKLFRDLHNGQAHIKFNIDTLMSAVALIKSRIEEKQINDVQLQESLKILATITTQINSEILVSGTKRGVKLSEVDSSELDGLPED